MNQTDANKSDLTQPDLEQTIPSKRLCDNCHGDVGVKDKMCTRCGFALSPIRSTKAKWRGISFPVFVFWVSVFCVLMMLWLPR